MMADLVPPRSGKGDKVGGVRSAGMLHDEDLGAREGVDRAVVAVGLAAEREDASVLRVPRAGHADAHQAHEHLPRAVHGRRTAEVAVGHVVCVARKVRPRAPEGRVARARSQRLEPGHRVGDDGLSRLAVCAVKRPARVNARLARDLLLSQGPLQGIAVRLEAPLLLQPILHALNAEHAHSIPHLLVCQDVGRRLPGCSFEDGLHASKLL
mmetsp:Transcript_90538/g.240459  ORF Transcript_90538/g.240459 Transcript_90538/m.240459 type:complete len:210 (+) Transcript_90538:180-809(+)